MSAELADVLGEFKKYMKEKALAKGWGNLPEWVFVGEKGELPSIYMWRDSIFKKASEKAIVDDMGRMAEFMKTKTPPIPPQQA